MPKKDAQDKFLNSRNFQRLSLVKTSNGMITYIEAVVTYCQENEIEIETVPNFCPNLKERLCHEAMRLNYMKKSSKGVLPL